MDSITREVHWKGSGSAWSVCRLSVIVGLTVCKRILIDKNGIFGLFLPFTFVGASNRKKSSRMRIWLSSSVFVFLWEAPREKDVWFSLPRWISAKRKIFLRLRMQGEKLVSVLVGIAHRLAIYWKHISIERTHPVLSSNTLLKKRIYFATLCNRMCNFIEGFAVCCKHTEQWLLAGDSKEIASAWIGAVIWCSR